MGKSKANFVSLPEMAEIVDFQYDGIRWALLSATGHGSADYSNDMLKNVTLSRISKLLEISTNHNSNPLQIYPNFAIRHIPDDEIVFIIKSLPEQFKRLGKYFVPDDSGPWIPGHLTRIREFLGPSPSAFSEKKSRIIAGDVKVGS